MKAGSLDRTIVVQRSSQMIDAAGAPSFTWATLVTLRAQLVQASAEEFRRAFGASSETAVIFRTWFYAGITLADRVIYDGLVHDILELKEIGRRQGLEIRTKSTGSPA